VFQHIDKPMHDCPLAILETVDQKKILETKMESCICKEPNASSSRVWRREGTLIISCSAALYMYGCTDLLHEHEAVSSASAGKQSYPSTLLFSSHSALKSRRHHHTAQSLPLIRRLMSSSSAASTASSIAGAAELNRHVE
jgi:hypothetical protein